ncbi:hypothetical protein VCUG_01567 [Vavraia culicis subsp. floridensis]|uniref:Uncharacterized protein n=1 Tax=Vavraia culicis (isolate floridensis) TaxID=948595 RepID=L2GUI7_VAVCU|nr:uncharacterized protein VCUG_01567 [Vavraia culicis subsp. floridensis]ELA46948.1 hypothetical protein VCUG_01567 [Vavraia culicis subsp. floridensis]
MPVLNEITLEVRFSRTHANVLEGLMFCSLSTPHRSVSKRIGALLRFVCTMRFDLRFIYDPSSALITRSCQSLVSAVLSCRSLRNHQNFVISFTSLRIPSSDMARSCLTPITSTICKHIVPMDRFVLARSTHAHRQMSTNRLKKQQTSIHHPSYRCCLLSTALYSSVNTSRTIARETNHVKHQTQNISSSIKAAQT